MWTNQRIRSLFIDVYGLVLSFVYVCELTNESEVYSLMSMAWLYPIWMVVLLAAF